MLINVTRFMKMVDMYFKIFLYMRMYFQNISYILKNFSYEFFEIHSAVYVCGCVKYN